MAQAVVDPEELRRFARNLHRFHTDLQEQQAAIRAQLISLGKTWRDQEHKKFSEEFEQQIKMLSRFTEVVEQHIPYLMRKAELIDQYLQQK